MHRGEWDAVLKRKNPADCLRWLTWRLLVNRRQPLSAKESCFFFFHDNLSKDPRSSALSKQKGKRNCALCINCGQFVTIVVQKFWIRCFSSSQEEKKEELSTSILLNPMSIDCKYSICVRRDACHSANTSPLWNGVTSWSARCSASNQWKQNAELSIAKRESRLIRVRPLWSMASGICRRVLIRFLRGEHWLISYNFLFASFFSPSHSFTCVSRSNSRKDAPTIDFIRRLPIVIDWSISQVHQACEHTMLLDKH